MRVGILGGGQLARMLMLAGYPLGLDFSVMDPARDACAAPLARHVAADWDDEEALEFLACATECITYEFENVPDETVRRLNRQSPVYPPPHALTAGRDRLLEKTLFNQLEIETAPFVAVESEDDLRVGIEQLGFPCVLKTRTLGYDGKGQVVLEEGDDPARAWRAIGRVPAILEGFVAFDREVSLIAVRGREGEMAFYPLTENRHRGGILRLSRNLADDPLQGRAEVYARRLMERLDYVGVLAIEFFEQGERLLANEMAPRVHNSGHWTIEGAVTSQFENHLRAIVGLPLGDTTALGHAAMVNLIGTVPDVRRLLQIPGAHLHLYGKAPRPGRKLGHLTLVEKDERLLTTKLAHLREWLPELEEAFS